MIFARQIRSRLPEPHAGKGGLTPIPTHPARADHQPDPRPTITAP